MSTEQKATKMHFTKEAKILLLSYVVEMILIFANFGIILAGYGTNLILVSALLIVSIFTYVYAKRLKKQNKLTK